MEMFNAIVLLAALMEPTPAKPAKPAFFQFDVESASPYVLFLDGEPVAANTRYKTPPIDEVVCLEIEIRYVCGGEVVSRKMYIDLKPGRVCHLKIVVTSKPEYVNC